MRAVTHRSLFLSLLLIILLAFTTLVTGASENGVRNASENSQRKIVVFRTGTEELQDKLLEKHGLLKIRDLDFINVKVAFIPKGRLNAVKAEPAVLRIEDDARAFILGKPDKPGKPPKEEAPDNNTNESDQTIPWGITAVNSYATDGTGLTSFTGSGVKVAVIDTGIDYTHPDLNVSVNNGTNIINPNKTFMDDNGHGTHVAGTIAAVNNNVGVVGVAPEATIYGVKVLDRKGGGWISDIAAGIQWSIDKNVDVINMSLGTTADLSVLRDAVEKADIAGIVVVAAAGNDGDEGNEKLYPGAYESVICVSAVSADNYDNPSTYSLAYFSSWGTQVDVTAPGVYVRSTVPDGGYRYYQGTSMASPHVAGVAALVIESERESYRDAIEQTADNSLLVDYDTDYYGAGLVNAKNAVIYNP